MVDERAAIAIPGPPAVATEVLGAIPVNSSIPPPVTMPPQPAPSPRSPPIAVVPLHGNGSADSAGLNGNGAGGGHARTEAQELDVPQPSERTKRFTPVRVLHVGTLSVPKGVVVTDAASSPFPESPRVGPSERFEDVASPAAGPSSLAPPSPSRLGLPAPRIARRMSNIDRRVRSEALPPQKRHMSIASTAASTRRPSILTGGYESSTDDDSKGEAKEGPEPGGAMPSPRHLRGSGLLNHHSAPHLTAPTRGRRRAQSLLVSPRPHESWSPSTPPASSRRTSRFIRPIVTGSPLRSPAGGRTPTDSMSRAPSEAMLFSQIPSRISRSVSGGGRSREPSGGAEENDRERDEQRKMEQQQRGNSLVTKWGHGPQRPIVLSADQIENLLGGDDDFSSAKARMAKHPRRQSSFTSIDPPQLPPSQSQPTSTPQTTSSSTFLPPNPPSFGITPPPLSRPYLVTAPPALTNGDWAGRDRSLSISSSVGTSAAAGTPLRIVTPHHTRRRALSTATLDSDGGHIPFTHHVPAVLPEDDDDIEDQELVPEDTGEVTDTRVDVDRTATATPNNGGEATPMLASLSPIVDDRTHDPKARRRISGLFGLRGRKRDISPPPPPTLTLLQATQPPTKKRAESDDRTRDRDAEMRRAELARREEEQMEEQRYKALLLVNAHPVSQRRAQRAAVHLDGYYALIDQGLENPPKLNLLAVLRWKQKNQAQKQAREKWMRENVDSSHLASPLLWPGGHSGPVSPASEAMRSLSPRHIGSLYPLPPHSIASATSKPEQHTGRNWQYTLDDIQGYNESGGRVDFFIPPNIPPPEPIPRERAQSFSIGSEAQLSMPSTESAMGHENDASIVPAHLVSPSTPSLTQPIEFADDATDSVADDLSRRASLEPSPGGMASRRGMHRSHHSTSGLPQPPRPIQTLRALGRGVKSNLVNAMTTGPVMTDNEDERRGATAPSWTVNSSANGQHQLTNAHSLRDSRGLLGLRRSHERYDNGDWVVTSDEDAHPFRRRFPRRIPRGFDKAPRRVITTVDDVNRSFARAEQPGDNKQALAREHSTAVKTKRAELELQAEEERRVIESEIYVQHQRNLLEAQQQLVEVERAEADMDNAITHFLGQLDDVSGVFSTAADVDVRFEGLEDLSRSECRASDDETADQLSPLAVESDMNVSDRNRWVSPRSPIRTHLRPGPSTAASQGLPSFAYGLQAWPKRSTLDPTLGVLINPFRRVELSCQKAETTLHDMEEKRASATRQIQEKVATINGFITQKDAVLNWVKDANKKIEEAYRQRRNKSQLVSGGLLETVLVLPGFDMVTDFLARAFLTVLSYFIRLQRLWAWALGRGYLAWAIVGAIISMLVVFYLVGSDTINQIFSGPRGTGAYTNCRAYTTSARQGADGLVTRPRIGEPMDVDGSPAGMSNNGVLAVSRGSDIAPAVLTAPPMAHPQVVQPPAAPSPVQQKQTAQPSGSEQSIHLPAGPQLQETQHQLLQVPQECQIASQALASALVSFTSVYHKLSRRLKQQLAEAERAVKEQATSVDEYRSDLEKLAFNYRSETERVAELQARLDTAEEANVLIKNTNATLDRERDKLEGRLKKNIEKMKQLENDANTKIAKVKVEEARSSQAKVDSVLREKTKIANQLRDRCNETEVLRRELYELKAIRSTDEANLRDKSVEGDGLRRELDELKTAYALGVAVALEKERILKAAKTKLTGVRCELEEAKLALTNFATVRIELEEAKAAELGRVRLAEAEIVTVRRELEQAKVLNLEVHRLKATQETEATNLNNKNAEAEELRREVAELKRSHKAEVEELKRTHEAQEELRREVHDLREQLRAAEKTVDSISRLRSKAGKLALRYGLSVTLVATHDDVSYIRSFFTAAQDRLGASEVVKVEVEEAAPRAPRAVYGINRAHRARPSDAASIARASGSHRTRPSGAPVRPEGSQAGLPLATPVTGFKRSRPSDAAEGSHGAQRRRASTGPSDRTANDPSDAELEAWYRPRLNWHVPVQDDGTRVLEYRSRMKKEGIILSKDEAKVFPITATSNADILAHIMTRHQVTARMVHFRKGAADL
ncbi:hypothetical protein CspHIS471_0208540 [Cutaneotrichosporon sp. HIS471]|nr:hypothetical protein CspHIS471_0208540 [Cutaneotrichosporon sp. HIS471]